MSDIEDHHGESLVIKVAGRDALPVRAIPYVTGWVMSPDDIAKQFGRVTDLAFSKLEHTDAFHMQGARAVKLLPKEWDRYIAALQGLEMELRIRFPDKDQGYAAWLSRSAEKLPPGVFVWLDEFRMDFARDHGRERLSVLDERDGDRELNLSPFLEEGVLETVLQGFGLRKPGVLARGGRQPQVSNAPEPIKPLSGAGYARSRQPQPAKWNKWKFIPKAQLWEAVCLTLDVEPDEEVLGMRLWFQSRRGVPRGLPPDFVDRLQIAQSNMSSNGPIRPVRLYTGALQSPHAEVLLSEVAAAAISWDWTLPEMMQALALPAAPSNGAGSVVTETQEQRQDRRLQACITAGLPMDDQSTRLRLPDGIGAVAESQGVKRQTFTADVKAALERRRKARREG